MKRLILIAILFLLTFSIFAAGEEDRVLEQETITLMETTRLNDALQILETISWKYDRKKIINLSNYDEAIGVPIHNLTWRKTLELIILKNNLNFEEKVGVVYVQNKSDQKAKEEKAKEASFDIFTKQVRISAVAFICDKAYLKSLGIDWSTLLDGKVKANINFSSANYVPNPFVNVTGSRAINLSNQTIEINTLLKTIESNQLGTVIARPQVTVSSGKKGFIQVGQDVSVKSVDDAGNTTDTFFATGVIMDVEPTVIPADTTNLVHLIATVERSSATPGSVSTVINKSKSSTDIILFDGEETVIGGLYDTDEIKSRGGIPILRDLPWWALGIRYLTGYYKIDKKERELIIILKADVMDDALTRQRNKP
jgi:type IV pilus assembly protein PilQ